MRSGARFGNTLRTRASPHRGPTRTLDEGIESSDTPRALQALVWRGYLAPGSMICPASSDRALEVGPEPIRRSWRWGYEGRHGPEGLIWGSSHWAPSLRDTTELSFAYTRRGITRNVASGKLLASDRGMRVDEDPQTLEPGHRGNHRRGWSVLSAAGAVEFVESTSDFEGVTPHDHLSEIRKGGSALPLSDLAMPVNI